MTGGQTDLFGDTTLPSNVTETGLTAVQHLTSNSPVYFASAEELQRHDVFLQKLNKRL
jgi:hypothetical protein